MSDQFRLHTRRAVLAASAAAGAASLLSSQASAAGDAGAEWGCRGAQLYRAAHGRGGRDCVWSFGLVGMAERKFSARRDRFATAPFIRRAAFRSGLRPAHDSSALSGQPT